MVMTLKLKNIRTLSFYLISPQQRRNIKKSKDLEINHRPTEHSIWNLGCLGQRSKVFGGYRLELVLQNL